MIKDKNNENYCFSCGSELKATGYDPLTEEHYYTCTGCNMDYTVTVNNDYTIAITIDTFDK